MTVNPTGTQDLETDGFGLTNSHLSMVDANPRNIKHPTLRRD